MQLWWRHGRAGSQLARWPTECPPAGFSADESGDARCSFASRRDLSLYALRVARTRMWCPANSTLSACHHSHRQTEW